MISDEVFISELEHILKARSIKKKQRTEDIAYAMEHVSIKLRDDYLEYQRGLIPKKERIPCESEEQKAFVAWFKKSYPGVVIMNIKNDNAKQHDIEMGIHPGASDLFIPQLMLFIEMKRTKNYKISNEQVQFKKYIESTGYLHAFCFGCEDAKNLIKTFNKKLIK